MAAKKGQISTHFKKNNSPIQRSSIFAKKGVATRACHQLAKIASHGI